MSLAILRADKAMLQDKKCCGFLSGYEKTVKVYLQQNLFQEPPVLPDEQGGLVKL